MPARLVTGRAALLVVVAACGDGGGVGGAADARPDAPRCAPLLEEPFDDTAGVDGRWTLAAKGTGSIAAVERGALALRAEEQVGGEAATASATARVGHPADGTEVLVDAIASVTGAVATFEVAWTAAGGGRVALIATRDTLRVEHEDAAGVATALCAADCPEFGDGAWLLGLRQRGGAVEVGAGHPADGLTYFARGPALVGDVELSLAASASITGDRVDVALDGILWTCAAP